MIDLTNQVAIVTGGSRGIGVATAILLAEAGADVAILYSQKRDSAENILLQIKNSGSRGMAVPMRVEDFLSCRRSIEKVIQKLRADRHSHQQCRNLAIRRNVQDN